MCYELKKHNINHICFEKGEILDNLKKYPNILWHSSINSLILPSKQNSKIKDSKKKLYDNDFIVRYYCNFVDEHKLDIKTHSKVYDISKNDDKYTVNYINSNTKQSISCKYIIICTGIYENNNKLKINTNYSFCHYNFKNFEICNKKILIVGSGNSSIDYITYLLPNNEIIWVIRGKFYKNNENTKTHSDKFISVMNKYKSNIKIYYKTEIVTINSDKSVLLSNNIIVNIDRILLLIGFKMENEFLKKNKY